MGLFDGLSRFFGQMNEVSRIARGDVVARLVPPDAHYVTAGLTAVLPDVRAFNGGEAGEGRYGRDLGYLPAPAQQRMSLLVLAQGRLLAVDEAETSWTCPVEDVLAVDGRRAGGFLVFTRRPDGLAVSQQTPVHRPDGATFRTVPHMTNLFGGWDQALERFGVNRHL